MDAGGPLLEGHPTTSSSSSTLRSPTAARRDPAQGLDLIPVAGRLLEAPDRRWRTPSAHQFADRLLVLAREEQLGHATCWAYSASLTSPATQAGAAAELVEQAGRVRLAPTASSHWRTREIFCIRCRLSRTTRAAGGVKGRNTPLHLRAPRWTPDARVPMVGDDDPGVGLVIPQQHVVAGLVLLDEVVLEDQRLGLGVGDRYLHRQSGAPGCGS